MTDMITLTGLVATIPRHSITSGGLPLTSFRLASTQRRFDRARNQWVDADTNWYTVTAFRQLAVNMSTSIQKGQRVLVTGRLRVKEWASVDKTGTNIEVDIEAIGHDLTWGTASFVRTVFGSSPATAASSAGSQQGDPAVPTDYSVNLSSTQWSSISPAEDSGNGDESDVDDEEDSENDEAEGAPVLELVTPF